MKQVLKSNEWQWRLARTIVQGILSVIVANIDLIFGQVVLDPAWCALVVALVMAVLSPVMAELASGGTAQEVILSVPGALWRWRLSRRRQRTRAARQSCHRGTAPARRRFWQFMRRGMPTRALSTTLPTGAVPRAGRA